MKATVKRHSLGFRSKNMRTGRRRWNGLTRIGSFMGDHGLGGMRTGRRRRNYFSKTGVLCLQRSGTKRATQGFMTTTGTRSRSSPALCRTLNEEVPSSFLLCNSVNNGSSTFPRLTRLMRRRIHAHQFPKLQEFSVSSVTCDSKMVVCDVHWTI